MRSLFHLFAFDDTYGPGTDLAFALVGIFILSTGITRKHEAANSDRLRVIAGNQAQVIRALAGNYNTTARLEVTEIPLNPLDLAPEEASAGSASAPPPQPQPTSEAVATDSSVVRVDSAVAQIDSPVKKFDSAVKVEVDSALNFKRDTPTPIADTASAVSSSASTSTAPRTEFDTSYTINSGHGTITVRNTEVTQLFTFGSDLLFDIGRAELKDQGMLVMGNLGRIIKQYAGVLQEIQIQGHADNSPSSPHDKYKSNMELASARATAVYNYFKDNSGIDPSVVLMSIVSYGEFKPVQRRAGHRWNTASLLLANDEPAERDHNRRIEIVLIYK